MSRIATSPHFRLILLEILDAIAETESHVLHSVLQQISQQSEVIFKSTTDKQTQFQLIKYLFPLAQPHSPNFPFTYPKFPPIVLHLIQICTSMEKVFEGC